MNTPEERARRLQEIPEIHADPNMDPNYISDDEEDDLVDKKYGISIFWFSELNSCVKFV